MSTASPQAVAVPRSPNLPRYRRLAAACKHISLTRALQYEYLSECGPLGRLLDVGGGESAKYRSLLDCEQYDSVNIDASIAPRWVVPVGQCFPVPPDEYQTVMSLNTLEHILDPEIVLQEMHRVLRSGGRLVLSVPFLMPIHGHPDDFFRPTSSWLVNRLSAAGFVRVVVIPLAWGPLSTGIMCSGSPGPLKVARMRAAMLLDLIYFRFHALSGNNDHVGQELARHPLGYFVFASKQ